MIAAPEAAWVVPAALAVRTLVVAVVVIAGLRLVGKRHLGQMNIADLAAVMAIANGVQNAMTHGTGLLAGGFASAATLLLLAAGLAFVARRAPRAERHLAGAPSLLVWDGEVLWERLHRHQILPAEIEAAVREHGLASTHDVLSATLEADGSISVVPREADHRIHRQAIDRPRDATRSTSFQRRPDAPAGG
jgi:uncharacterized membrane protein YcaP (DUF421 family)